MADSAAAEVFVEAEAVVDSVVVVAQAAQMQDESWWKESRLIPVGMEMASVLEGYVETGRQVIDEVAESST